jgi:hypothetical protein
LAAAGSALHDHVGDGEGVNSASPDRQAVLAPLKEPVRDPVHPQVPPLPVDHVERGQVLAVDQDAMGDSITLIGAAVADVARLDQQIAFCADR